jgi:hypothetical protein
MNLRKSDGQKYWPSLNPWIGVVKKLPHHRRTAGEYSTCSIRTIDRPPSRTSVLQVDKLRVEVFRAFRHSPQQPKFRIVLFLTNCLLIALFPSAICLKSTRATETILENEGWCMPLLQS